MYLEKMRKPNPYVMPRDRNTSSMITQFLEYQLIKQERYEGVTAGCIKKIKERIIKRKPIPLLEWIK